VGVLVSLAFVFTQTIGDPDRDEDVARAVLADSAARSEVAEPIAAP
jgi:hypothetical protein